MAENVQEADWAPNGSDLLVVRDVGGEARIEFPIGKVLYETTGYVSDAKLSRDGKRIAWVDHPFSQDDSGWVALMDLSDPKKKTITPRWNKAGGLAWSPKGDEIWFTATDTGANLSLYAVTPSGQVRVLVRVPGGIRLQDVAPNGRVLWRAGARGSARSDFYPATRGNGTCPGSTTPSSRDISADGQTLLFDEEGERGRQLHGLSAKSGSPVVKLGEGAALSLSADTQWALAALSAPNPSLVLLPTGAGQPRRLEVCGVTPSQFGAWLPDMRAC